MHTFRRVLVAAVSIAALLYLDGGMLRALQQNSLAEVLDHVGAYVQQYNAKLSAVISQESYSQTVITYEGDPAQKRIRARAIKSQLLLLSGGDGRWLCFRDVFEVDGKAIPDHVGRLARLLATSPAESAGAGSLANQIAWESSRYNLGDVRRNFNVPTMALDFLRRDNQGRSAFRQAGTQKVNGNACSVVSFVEKVRPTLVRGVDDHDVVGAGRAWIDASGQVEKTELSLKAESVDALVTVVYGTAPNLNVLVPLSMHEDYQAGAIEAFATYSDFVVPAVRVDVTGFKEAVDRTGRGGGD